MDGDTEVAGLERNLAEAAERFVARCPLTNAGDESVSVNLAPMSSPSLALEIADAAGGPVYLPPPPVPRARYRYRAGPGEPIVSTWVGFSLTR